MVTQRLVVLSLGLVVGAFGQPSISPAQLRLAAQAGSSTAATEIFSLFSSGSLGPNADFDLSIRYGSAPAGWLSVNRIHGTTPATLTIAANPSNLPVGTYSAQILATVGPLQLSAVTTVSFIVAPGGSNPGGLAVNPSSLTFLGDPASTPQSISISNAPGVVGSVPFSVFANPSSWLAITQSDRTTPATVKVQLYSSGVSPGAHTAAVTVTALDTGKSTVVPITLVVPDAAVGQTTTLTPAQRSLTFNYQLGSSLNPSQTVLVGTGSSQYTNFTATVSDAWLGVAANYGLPATHSIATFAPGLFYVLVDPTGLSAGVYKGTVVLSAPGQDSIDVPVTFTVSSSAVLNATPSFISLDSQSNTLSANIAITSSEALSFTAVVAPNTPWLSITPNSRISSTSPTDLTVAAIVGGLPSGTYNSSISFVGAGGRPALTVPVQLKVSGAAVLNTLEVIPTALDFTGLAGDPVVPKYVNISSKAGVSQSVTLAAVADGGWFTVEPLSASLPIYAKVAVSTAVAPGSYTGSILITELGTGEQETISVTYKLTARLMTVTPNLLTFTQAEKGALLPPQELAVSANAPSTFRVVSQPAWANVQPATGLTTPVKLVVTANATGMTPGSYQGNIVLSGPNDLTVPVSLTVAAPAPLPPPTVTPSSLSFAYELGSPPPPPQTVTITSATGTLPFSITASTESGVKWLDVTPTTGSTPGAITVSLNVGQLVPGRQSGTVTVRLESSPVSTFDIPVTLSVAGSAIQIREVLNAATLLPTVLSPGEIVTLTGTGIGPALPRVAQPSAGGAFGTELAGVRVLFDGIAAPLLLVQEAQINAIAPYALQGRSTARVQVQVDSSYSVPIDLKVADAAPGIFTLGNGGKGQAAALNGDFSGNSVLNPAPRGGVIILYLTGEGQTDPAGQDGRVINSDLRKPLLPVTALIGGKPAEVLYAGSGAMLVSGLCQVNIRIPEGLAPGAQALEIQVGGIPTQRGVTIAVY